MSDKIGEPEAVTPKYESKEIKERARQSIIRSSDLHNVETQDAILDAYASGMVLGRPWHEGGLNRVYRIDNPEIAQRIQQVEGINNAPNGIVMKVQYRVTADYIAGHLQDIVGTDDIERSRDEVLVSVLNESNIFSERLRRHSGFPPFRNAFENESTEIPYETVGIYLVPVTGKNLKEMVSKQIKQQTTETEDIMNIDNNAIYFVPAAVSFQALVEENRQRSVEQLSLGAAEFFITTSTIPQAETYPSGQGYPITRTGIMQYELNREAYINLNEQLVFGTLPPLSKDQVRGSLNVMGNGSLGVSNFLNYYDRSDPAKQEIIRQFIKNAIEYTNNEGYIIDAFGGFNVMFVDDTQKQDFYCLLLDAYYPEANKIIEQSVQILNRFAQGQNITASLEEEKTYNTVTTVLGYVRSLNLMAIYMDIPDQIDIFKNSESKAVIDAYRETVKGKDLRQVGFSAQVLPEFEKVVELENKTRAQSGRSSLRFG